MLNDDDMIEDSGVGRRGMDVARCAVEIHPKWKNALVGLRLVRDGWAASKLCDEFPWVWYYGFCFLEEL